MPVVEPQTWTTLIIPSLALAAVIVFGILNLIQARRGPSGKPKWSIAKVNPQRYQLAEDGGADARDVRIEFEPDGIQVRCALQHDVFHRGQRENLLVLTSWGYHHPRIIVTWAGKRGKRERWEADLP
ncbi:hypothetical protein WEH80_37990 [Actinomycetes bacterium KLBMP 9759]